MVSARGHHTATRLPSGKVLVAGGYYSGSAIASAEVYDPATNSWSSVSTMPTPRYNHTATLLLSGRLLITGGYNSSSGTPLSSTALYTP